MDYDALEIKIDPESGFLGVEWRGLFIYHGPRALCESYCIKFAEKLDQVKAERSSFDGIKPGDYLLRKNDGPSYMVWLIKDSKIALDGTGIYVDRAPGFPQSIHERLDFLEYKSREEDEPSEE